MITKKYRTKTRTRTRTGGNGQNKLNAQLKKSRKLRLNKLRQERLNKLRQEIKKQLLGKQKTGKRGTRMINPIPVTSPMRDSLHEFTESPLTASPMINVGNLRFNPGSPTASERKSLGKFDLNNNNN